MYKNTLPLTFYVFSFFLFGCQNTELKSRISELEIELDSTRNTSEQLSTQFKKVDFLIDSITKSESYIAFNLEAGTTYQDHIDRLRGLSAFVEYTRQKMLKLEQSMVETNSENTALQLLISKMRKELENKDKIISQLRQQVNEYEAENEELIKLVDLQKREIIDIEQQLKLKMTALKQAETNISRLKSESDQLLADTFFEKAEATEEIANRTNFAPKKKKEALEKAINLYKMAFDAGRQDAQVKIEALEKRL